MSFSRLGTLHNEHLSKLSFYDTANCIIFITKLYVDYKLRDGIRLSFFLLTITDFSFYGIDIDFDNNWKLS